jgi:uncharacterized protein YgfB (UPF0149 family)
VTGFGKRDGSVRAPDYLEVQALLGESGSGPTTAEAHGTLCGLLCVAADDLPAAWIENTLADLGADSGAAEAGALADVHAWTAAAIRGDEMGLDLMLPEDEVPLAARTEALARWCQGFLYGLAVRGLKDPEQLPAPIGELVNDFSQISQASLEGEEDEQGEGAYAELVEYVRVGVQLIFDELNTVRRD